jgi:hypothetical protein
MNKIVLNIGLLAFFISLIIFSQQNIPLEDVFLRAFAIFVIVTLMTGILVIVFFKAVAKAMYEKAMQKQDSMIMGNEDNGK